jgi:hypothetical protein
MPVVHVTRTRFFFQLSPSKASFKNNTLAHQKGSHQAQNQTSSFPIPLSEEQCDPAISFPTRRIGVLLCVGAALKKSEIGHQGLEETSRNTNRTSFPLGGVPTMSKYSLTVAEGFSSLSSFATLQLCCYNRVAPDRLNRAGRNNAPRDQPKLLRSTTIVAAISLTCVQILSANEEVASDAHFPPENHYPTPLGRDNQWIVPPCTSASENSLQH